MEVLVKTVTGRYITVEFENPELVEHVKIRVKCDMHVFVENGDERMKIMIEKTQTVRTLKRLIAQTTKTNISIDNMCLRYLGNKLQDSRTLADYYVEEGSALILGGYVRIFIQSDGKATIALEMGSWELIRDVKTKIKKFEGIVLEEHTLIFKNRRLRDDCSLGDYGIRMNSTLQLCPVSKVYTLIKMKLLWQKASSNQEWSFLG